MKPETVHFIAQLIRQQRGLATAAERWVRSDDFSKEEALNAIYTFRLVLDSYEAQLSIVVTDNVVTRQSGASSVSPPVNNRTPDLPGKTALVFSKGAGT